MMKNRLLTPFQKFVKTGSKAGMLLFGATIIALIWANSAYGNYYESLLQYKIGISFENFELKKALILWINDGLMAIFFFLVGLELKRELLVGEINSLKKAAFPLMAALGGVIVPIILYLVLNQNPETAKGWGIPMATDIAFALAILSLLGKRVPLSLKVFLTAFAIIDDIAAVIVIAVFYSSNVSVELLSYGLVLIMLLGLLYRFRKYSLGVGLVLAVIIWFLFLKSGIHPTIAGVLLAFTIPIKKKISLKSFTGNLIAITDKIKHIIDVDNEKHILSKDEMNYINNLNNVTSEVVSPLQYLEQKLHGITAYFILPVFAFANAGVVINASYEYDYGLMTSIIVSLFVGKFVGVIFFSYIGIKLKIAELPAGLKFKQIVGAAAIAGVGFTMSIFIGNLAFLNSEVSITSTKTGIIIGSLISGIVGYTILRLTSKSDKT